MILMQSITIALITFYLTTGLILVMISRPRSLFEDFVFFAAWPYFVLRHIFKGY